MKILWDFRLFSHGYAHRGVGVYVTAVAEELLAVCGDSEIVVWGDRSRVPAALQLTRLRWIDYHGGSWKKSMIVLPVLVLRHGIDLVHYWIALGPVHAIGMAPLLSCPSVATVYDAGVEQWDLPYSVFIRKTLYWRMQKKIFASVKGVVAISETARRAVGQVVPLPAGATTVVYPPLENYHRKAQEGTERTKRFVTLGGSPHKNCRRVVEAFTLFRKEHADYTLTIMGEIDLVAELPGTLPDGVEQQPCMDQFSGMLSTAAALVYCSLYEGLGLPPLEAMQYGTPLLLSSIPSLIETCDGAACFVDPLSVVSIAGGMATIAGNLHEWVSRSRVGAITYNERTRGGADTCRHLYRRVAETGGLLTGQRKKT